MKLPHDYSPGEKVRDIYTGKINTVSKSYWQWYAGPPTSDYTIEFAEGGWNKSTNLAPVETVKLTGNLAWENRNEAQ